MSDEFDALLERVRERVTPDDAERERVASVGETVAERARAAVTDLPVEATVRRVGSTARDTWLAGDRDVDVFVCFPPEVEREDLEDWGLTVGTEAIPDGHAEFAEHPYVSGEVDGVEVDLVPCFDVDAAVEARSAVDRTPFHTDYVAERLDDEVAGEVRVAKAFLTAIGAYGSDLRTRGFSGYLVELLVLEYGDFRGLLAAAADWHPHVELDPADHGDRSFDDPLVVVDPTDPERNVAAVVSAANVARLQHHARALLADPREECFEASAPDPIGESAARAAFADRGTTPVAVCFEAPDVVDDQLWPQLERSREGVVGGLDRRGFDVLRSAAFADDRAVLLAECAVAERPAIERHEGPPVHVREHATGFFETYADADVAGPFLDGDRYVVEREREFRTPAAFLESEAIFDVALGRQVADALADGYDVLVGDDVATLADDFGVELAQYLEPTV